MPAIAKRPFGTVFATTEIHSPILFRRVRNRGELAPFMGTIAERLVGTFPAGTPVIGFTSLDFDRKRRFLDDVRAAHS